YINGFFHAHADQSFLYHFPLPTEHWSGGGMDRIEHWHYHWQGKDLRFPRNSNGGKFSLPSKLIDAFLPKKRSLPDGLTPFGGSGYWCLASKAVRYVYDYVNDHPEFIRFFRSVYIPDEIFFHTILMNSPMADTIINDDLRHIDWSESRPGTKPAILNRSDIVTLCKSPDLFARKFDVTVDGEILELIDGKILNVRVPEEGFQSDLGDTALSQPTRFRCAP
ncbi:MAG TPA: beta-1,6-N-acetylglucosaminyltransferase, partial [Pyrinomonadaceae bacterium]|nr:beta-1,6-N-acetylglucosaminyltransferase [Pyrinomonadaceae bacterium]